MKVILIGHKKRMGKDTFAKMLAQHLGKHGTVEIRSFAEPLKRIYADMKSLTLLQLEELKNKSNSQERRELQRLGSGKLKSYFGKDIWAKLLVESIDEDKVDYLIIPDFRFPDEVLGDYTIKVVRETNIEDDCSHISETALDDFNFDYTITNDGTLNELYDKARTLSLVLS